MRALAATWTREVLGMADAELRVDASLDEEGDLGVVIARGGRELALHLRRPEVEALRDHLEAALAVPASIPAPRTTSP